MGKSYFLPVHRYAALQRPHLVQRALDSDPALIIIRGTAGAGKSVLAQQIAERFAADGGVSVWVRMGPDDDGPQTVWQRIFAAISDAGLVAKDSLVSGLAEGGLSAVTAHIMAQAVAELTQPMLLVLDDLHGASAGARDPQLDESLLSGLEASANVTILITSRTALRGLGSPAARARVPVREFEADELALSLEETEALVGLRLPRLTHAERAALAQSIFGQTKGWPLIAHSIIVEHDAVARNALGARRRNLVSDYTGIVLQESTPEMQVAFCASALLDEISVDAFASMLEISEHEAERILEGMFEASSGSWEDESGVRWYRHHDLIRAELRRHAPSIIGAEQLKQMCARAATTIGGSRSDLAIQAALHGESWAFLSTHLIHLTDFMMHRSRPVTWFSDIPESVRREYPVLAAFALVDEYAFPAGRARQVLAGFRLLADKSLAAESSHAGMPGLVASTLRMIAGRLSGNDKLATDMADRVADAIDEVSNGHPAMENPPRDTATTQAAITLIHTGQPSRAVQLLEPIHIWSDRVLPRSRTHASALSAWALAMQGEMRESRQFLKKSLAFELPLGWRDSYIGAGYRIAGATDALERGEAAEAAQHLAALSEHEATIEHWPFLAVIEAYIVETLHGPGESLERLNRQLARRRGKFAPMDAAMLVLKAQRARLQWQSGQVLTRSLMRKGSGQLAIFAALSRGESDEAAQRATTLLHQDHAVSTPRAKTELLLLEAEALVRVGDLERAQDSARLATRLMSEYELTLPMRVLSRSTAEALSVEIPRMVAEHSPPDAVRDITPLTSAELNAFRAVIDHGTVPAAAAALFLSPETVKGHMKVVYRKLGARSRDEAVRIAVQARLFESRH